MPTGVWNERFRYPSDKLFLSWVSLWHYTILNTYRPAFISQLISYSKFWFETNTVALIACSRRSDSRPREKNSQGKKNEGRLEGERGRRCTTSLAPHLPPRFTIWTPGTGYRFDPNAHNGSKKETIMEKEINLRTRLGIMSVIMCFALKCCNTYILWALANLVDERERPRIRRQRLRRPSGYIRLCHGLESKLTCIEASR